MRYVVKRIQEMLRYFVWWRLLLLLTTVTLAVVAVSVESGGGWFMALAALPAVALYASIGTRVSANHAAVKRIANAKSSDVAKPPMQQRAPEVSPHMSKPPVPRARAEAPDVSIIVAAFNERDYILDCLESIRLQTWENFQCIVVDDRSTDDTAELVFDHFSADGRFEFLSLRANVGLSMVRNIGLAHARAPWVTFVDGDDFLYERALESRLATLAAETDNPWIAGAYCNWLPVPQDQQRTATGKDLPKRRRITWLDALHDAPFVASAPIVRTSIVRALGGFRRVNAAEDADMWTKILRHGYVFLPTHYTGIAYRQKERSMFRTETVEHAAVTVDIYVTNYQDLDPSSFIAGTPFAFERAAPVYITEAESFRRNLIAFTTAVAQADQNAVERLAGLLDITESPYLPWVVDVDRVILQAAKRAESYSLEGATARSKILAERAKLHLGHLARPKPTVPQLPLSEATATASDTASGITLGVGWAKLRDRQRLHLTSERTAAKLANHIVLMPSAAYHIEELGPLAAALGKKGLPAAFMVSDRRWNWTEPGLRAWDFPILAFPEDMAWTEHIAGIVTLNDWGEAPHDAIVAANGYGVPTFAKVEGVQDFEDVDVHWTRHAYQTATHVLCQGPNDESALASRANTHIVGSSRLEAIWDAPPRRLGPDMAVVNLNFTYGVLEDAREMWVDTVMAAGKQLGMRMVFSLHPAEKNRPRGAEISNLPIRHLLTQASVLISRFSTVPFEAMARGVPFVYHNPHHEKVPTFLTPDGAFEVTVTAEELAAAIEATRPFADSYRAKAERFFRAQIDMSRDADPATRAAARIHEVVTGDSIRASTEADPA
jgi:glycosyltransferase involved in cell wall biosynthesis